MLNIVTGRINSSKTTKITELYNLTKKGDGFVSINGANLEIDQHNKPDYPAYHLEKIKTQSGFEEWFQNNTVKFNIKSVEDISVASDGILSFRCDNYTSKHKLLDSVEYLSADKNLSNIPIMLYRKYNVLKNKSGLLNNDDIAMIRIINPAQ